MAFRHSYARMDGLNLITDWSAEDFPNWWFNISFID